MPKISVIIPCYNTEKYLRECLDSVINQTLKDIEIICINDGSTDNSGKILDEYAKKDNRIKVIHKENEGAGVARNVGISLAKGEYLSILDSDDVFELNMLELLLQKSESTNADITICRSQILNLQNNQIEDMSWSLKYLPDKEIFSYKDFLPFHVFDFCIGWSWDKLYKTSFVKEYNLEFQNLRSTNDAYFVFLSLCLAKKITTIEDILITHRVNTNQQLSETREKDPLCFIDACKKIRDSLIKYNLYDDLEQSFLNWFLSFTLWHINSLPIKHANIIKKNIVEVFEEFKCFEKKEGFYINKNDYKMLNIFAESSTYSMQQELILSNNKIDRLNGEIDNMNNKIARLEAIIEAYVNKDSFIETIFSVKNQVHGEIKHKVITILGIKIKLKRKYD